MGVEATCKIIADTAVAAGSDIDTLEAFADIIQQRCTGITILTIGEEGINKLTSDIQKDIRNIKSFIGTFNVYQVKGKITKCHLGLSHGASQLIMKSLSCSCEDQFAHFNLGLLQCRKKIKPYVEDIYTDSECERESFKESDISQAVTCDKITEFENITGPSSVHPYRIVDYVLVKFPVRNNEYRYVAAINQIYSDEGELTVTFLKIFDDTGHSFKIDEDDVSDVTFEQILEKLSNPNLIKKGKRIFYFFISPVPVSKK